MDIQDYPDEQVTKLQMAKEAARLAINSLHDGDVLGVIAFDTEYSWVVPMHTIQGQADRDRAGAQVAALPPGAGTSIYPAVQEAEHAMRSVQAPNRHVVLLTDGQEWETADYGPVLDRMRAGGVTLSAIGIGRDADRELLMRLARLGQGRYYFTERTQNIPRIVFRELEVALKDAMIEGDVQPQVLVPSPVLRGLSPQDLPLLGGYEATTARDGVSIALVTGDGDPLLAHWQYGLGRVVAFTSDAGHLWTRRWPSWDGFAQLWDRAVRWTLALPVNRHLQPSVSVLTVGTGGAGKPGTETEAVSAGGFMAHITIESLNPDNSFADLADVTVAVRAPSGAITSTLLVQSAPGQYEGDVPVDEAGVYEVRVVRATSTLPGAQGTPRTPQAGGDEGYGGGQAITETVGFSVPAHPELMYAGTNHALLRRLAGGLPDITQPAQALDPANLPAGKGGAPVLYPLWGYLLAPALLLLLLSVAIRLLNAPGAYLPASIRGGSAPPDGAVRT
jgi:hypothetical protein